MLPGEATRSATAESAPLLRAPSGADLLALDLRVPVRPPRGGHHGQLALLRPAKPRAWMLALAGSSEGIPSRSCWRSREGAVELCGVFRAGCAGCFGRCVQDVLHSSRFSTQNWRQTVQGCECSGRNTKEDSIGDPRGIRLGNYPPRPRIRMRDRKRTRAPSGLCGKKSQPVQKLTYEARTRLQMRPLLTEAVTSRF